MRKRRKSRTLPAECNLDDKVEAVLVLRVVKLCLGGGMVEASPVSLCSLCLLVELRRVRKQKVKKVPASF